MSLAAALFLAAAAPAAVPPAADRGAAEAEIAFARAAQKRGQWTAFRAFAAPDAVMFTPRPVRAQAYLKGRADPRQAVQWWAAHSYVACDGSVAVNSGPWIRAGQKSVGYFTTIWARQNDGGWKWIADHGDTLPKARAAGEKAQVRVASCNGTARPYLPIVPASATESNSGRSHDGTLLWLWSVDGNGARRLSVELWNGTGYDRVVDDRVAASAP